MNATDFVSSAGLGVALVGVGLISAAALIAARAFDRWASAYAEWVRAGIRESERERRER